MYTQNKPLDTPEVPNIDLSAQGAVNNVMQNYENTAKYSNIHTIKKNSFKCGGGRTLNIDMTTPMPGPTFNGALTIGKPCPTELSNISVTPNSTDYMLNLKSANPPPGYERSNPTIYLNPSNNTDQVGGADHYIMDPVNKKTYFIKSKNGQRVLRNYQKHYRKLKT